MDTARWNSFGPVHVRRGDRNRSETRLHGDPATIARAFHADGEGVVFTRHPAAFLASCGASAEIATHPSAQASRSADRSLLVDFSHWRDLRAVDEGARFGLSVRNEHGAEIHGRLFVEFRQRATFAGLVERFAVRCESQPELPRAAWNHQLHQRLDWIYAMASDGSAPRRAGLIRELLILAAAKPLALRISVCVGGLIQRANCRPAEVGTMGDFVWVRAGGHGLQVTLSGLGEVWIVGGRCSCCGEDRLTVEAYDRHGQLALTLQVAKDEEEPVWRALLDELGTDA